MAKSDSPLQLKKTWAQITFFFQIAAFTKIVPKWFLYYEILFNAFENSVALSDLKMPKHSEVTEVWSFVIPF